MKELIEQIKKARLVFICGNGGSSANAEHFTNDLFSKGIKAINLSSNTSIMTMIANDFGYDQVFSKQLEIYADREDLFITISCSGTSANIVEALAYAKFIGIKTYEFEIFGKDRDFEKLENEHLRFAHAIKKLL
ncbi:MAG: SIS domain-containing protein [Candidatus Curtissbacteria bacterium]|nr:SIS domain-containing protein [Candidatus Curtissbacteria bacterium]